MSAEREEMPRRFWAHWMTGSGKIAEKRGLTATQLDDLRDSVEAGGVRVSWGTERVAAPPLPAGRS